MRPTAASVASAAASDEEYGDSDFDEQIDLAAAAKSGKRQLRAAALPQQVKKPKKR